MSGGDRAHDTAAVEARALIAGWQRHGLVVVFTNGCFDVLHVGHVRFLREARALGDRLVVAVNDDESVRRLKGPGRPYVPFDERAELLRALAAVDLVVGFGEPTPCALLERLAPDIACKGGDYRGRAVPEARVIERLGGAFVVLGLTDGRSTTALAAAIAARSEPPA